MKPTFLFSIFAVLAATAAAMPTENLDDLDDLEARGAAPDLEARSPVPELEVRFNAHELQARGCPSSKKINFQGGGCETDWADNCYDRCVRKGLKKKCCKGTVNSAITGSGCWTGWNTCECSCMKR
ncbi:hypothetical protein FQN55_000784 [Onygenales sp. PD_40]|nr:hypothetical protein FQN55_000784 [Onygenales sp. PD_40]KAK2775493.1 hypothetical protein FQN53_003123 [Emmonsiellopsis sp. PD_33]KAK2783995.1 hypothetical protein FQN52_009374 [Onygenales sp. PD_12]KAK2798420.1 hypothetical protein FQN51_007683 [Onygenales sp. PD_10]